MLFLRRVLFSALLAAFFGIALAGSPVQFENAWSPEAPPVAPVMAGYVKITNNSKDPMVITATRCPDFNKVEIHDMQHTNGMMRMIKQEKLPIAPGKSISLEPGDMHIMLIKPKRVIKAGESLPVIFEFSDGSSVTVPFTVKVKTNLMQHNNH